MVPSLFLSILEKSLSVPAVFSPLAKACSKADLPVVVPLVPAVVASNWASGSLAAAELEFSPLAEDDWDS